MTLTLPRLVSSLKGDPAIQHVSTVHYECYLCGGLNDRHHVRCQFCGSFPLKLKRGNRHVLTTIAAWGSERAESRRAHRVYFRTVPADYYADNTR